MTDRRTTLLWVAAGLTWIVAGIVQIATVYPTEPQLLGHALVGGGLGMLLGRALRLVTYRGGEPT